MRLNEIYKKMMFSHTMSSIAYHSFATDELQWRQKKDDNVIDLMKLDDSGLDLTRAIRVDQSNIMIKDASGAHSVHANATELNYLHGAIPGKAVHDKVLVYGTSGIDDDFTFNSTVTMNQDLVSHGHIVIEKDLIVGSSITTSTINVHGDANFYAHTQVQSIVANEQVTAGSLHVSSGGHLSGDFTFTHPINVPTPTTSAHAAPKSYVDSMSQGLTQKSAVRVATTAEWADSFVIVAYDRRTLIVYTNDDTSLTIDGVTFAHDLYAGKTLDEGDVLSSRILIKDQALAQQNGVWRIYAVADISPVIYNSAQYKSSWTLVRAPDCDEPTDIERGAFVFVEDGTVNSHRGFVLQEEAPHVFDATPDGSGTPLTFIQFSGAPIIKNGNVLGLDLSSEFTALNGKLTLAHNAIGNEKLANDSVTLSFFNGIAGTTESIALGGSGQIGIDSDAHVMLKSLHLSSQEQTPSLVAGNARFAGTVECEHILQTSDERVKDSVDMDTTACLRGVLALKPKVYSLKPSFASATGSTTAQRMGLLAQALACEFPLAVKTASSPSVVSTDGTTVADLHSVDYTSLIAPIVGALQELNSKLEKLSKRIGK